MSQPLFSVVTVTLNCADNAVRTAQSVLAQDFADYEYMVKDGGSTDGTVERLQELGIEVCVEKDSGIYDAMSQALQRCRGQFVCFLNAGDDFVAPNVLRTVSEAIKQHPSAGLFYGDLMQPDIPMIIHYPERLSKSFLYRKIVCHQVCFTSRLAIAGAGGFDTSFRLMADYDLLLRLVLGKGICYNHVPSVVVNYRQDGQSSRRSNLPVLLYERSRILSKYFTPMRRVLFELLILSSGRPLRRFLWHNPYTFPLVRWYLGRSVIRGGRFRLDVEENR